jgi:mannose-6-phosphate isomerase
MADHSPELYPLLLHPQFHERVWGARSLAPIYSREITGAPIGEAWLTGDACLVANGPFQGHSLGDLSRKFGPSLIGPGANDATQFPLLIKFLFPNDKLSVQVHPDDDGARTVGQSCGKTECWYILSAEKGAQVGLGMKPGTTKAEVEEAIRDTRMEELLNWVDVRAGDMIYVDAGTVHAIGPGAVIVETQQNSDTTYRLYDYGRPRELHIEAGLRAMKEHTHAGKVRLGPGSTSQGMTRQNLITSPCFIVDKFELKQPWQFLRPKDILANAWCMVATRGCGTIELNGMEPLTFTAGESVVVPATLPSFVVRPQWDMEFLCSSVPVETVPQPNTVLVEAADKAAV